MIDIYECGKLQCQANEAYVNIRVLTLLNENLETAIIARGATAHDNLVHKEREIVLRKLRDRLSKLEDEHGILPKVA